jgi:hypothetical protein
MSRRMAAPVVIGATLLWLMAAGAAGIVLALLSLAPASLAGSQSPLAAFPAPEPAPSAEAPADITPLYLALYRQAAARFDLDWAVLAGIGRVECDHGRDPDPSCTVEGQLNYAGAGGPAQFLSSTWRIYGISASGIGPPDMWNPDDAIFSMANYLHASGAPTDYPKAIFAYNHAWWYVADVLAWARRYRSAYGD